MGRTKVRKFVDGKRIVYSQKHWKHLAYLRNRAIEIMKALESFGLNCIIHGSVARGDVHEKSDIDIVIPYLVPSYRVEMALENYGFKPYLKIISQATPAHAIKAHIYLDEITIITFPLTPLSKLEREFYKFSGELSTKDLERGLRVPGVDKRLMLIIPTDYGHIEKSIIGIEKEVANFLGVSIDIVEERKNVLLRRDEIGRTGVFLKKVINIHETFEEALYKISKVNIFIRKKLQNEGLL